MTVTTHKITTKVGTRRKRGQGKRCDLSSDRRMATYSFVAIGDAKDITGPNEFKYSDAFTVWEARTDTLFSNRLTSAIKSSLHPYSSYSRSIFAEHLVFCSLGEGNLRRMELDRNNCEVRFRDAKSSEHLLNSWAHNPKDEPLDKKLEADKSYAHAKQRIKQAHLVKPDLITIKSSSQFRNLYSKYFCQDYLPMSYVWPTIQYSCPFLPIPNQLGVGNRLYSKYESGAHFKFSRPSTPPRTISMDDVIQSRLDIRISNLGKVKNGFRRMVSSLVD